MVSLVVVLPAEPVTPISGLPHSRRTAAPSRCSASSESSTTSSRDLERKAPAALLLHHGGHGAFGECGFHIVVAVEPLAADGEEQVARLKRARIDGVAGGNGRASEFPVPRA